jgi:hypothetical protein
MFISMSLAAHQMSIEAALFESKVRLPKKIWRAETMPVYSVLRVITDHSGLHASGPRGIYSRFKG